MSMYRVMQCDGACGRRLTWSGRPTQAEMEQAARDQGWHAPDRLGRHWCLNCRSESGRIQWWRRENVRRGLPAEYGLGQCKCRPGDPPEMDRVCCLAGHPEVDRRV